MRPTRTNHNGAGGRRRAHRSRGPLESSSSAPACFCSREPPAFPDAVRSRECEQAQIGGVAGRISQRARRGRGESSGFWQRRVAGRAAWSTESSMMGSRRVACQPKRSWRIPTSPPSPPRGSAETAFPHKIRQHRRVRYALSRTWATLAASLCQASVSRSSRARPLRVSS